MKCKDCNVVGCVYRTSDAEKECEFQSHVIQVPDEWRYVRIQAAIAAMQGFLSCPHHSANWTTLAEDSVKLANCLIEVLKEKSNEISR